MAVDHYENFPVGSILVPKHLRRPIHAIYAFSRVADDYADEGNDSDEMRLANLQALSDELLLIDQGKRPVTALMQRLQDEAIAPHGLPTHLFEDLLDAFRQDVVKKRYQEFEELIDYSRRSANPIGRLLLCLYGVDDERSLQQGDAICTALQLINFWQDVAIDWQKGRVYLPQESLRQFNVLESDIGQHKLTPAFQNMMAAQCQRAFQMLQDGAPLIAKLPGRLRWELSMIVLGGERIVRKLMMVGYDVFTQRPVLTKRDWLWILKQLLMGKIATPIR